MNVLGKGDETEENKTACFYQNQEQAVSQSLSRLRAIHMTRYGALRVESFQMCQSEI